MLRLRPAAERGHFDHGWLKTWHTFSFAEYRDPEHRGFGPLRVINEDIVAPATGFGRHGHRDMEILTYMLSGSIRHQDSTGGGGIIRPGRIQRMSAGTGIEHSETNPDPAQPAHLLQIWIRPDREGHDPSYEDRDFPEENLRNRLCLIASPNGEAGSLELHRDVRVYAARLDAEIQIQASGDESRFFWVQIARGSVTVRGLRETVSLQAGDGLGASEESSLVVAAGTQGAELLVFDMA